MKRPLLDRLTKHRKRRGRPPRYLTAAQLENPAPSRGAKPRQRAGRPIPKHGSLWILWAIRSFGQRGYLRHIERSHRQITEAAIEQRQDPPPPLPRDLKRVLRRWRSEIARGFRLKDKKDE
jgi:hypothetical protein